MTDERGQRVSDAKLAQLIEIWSAYPDDCWVTKALADLRDARSALATATRDGWIAGRDAAAEISTTHFYATSSAMTDDERTTHQTACQEIAAATRALEPPESFAADVGGPEPAKTEGGC